MDITVTIKARDGSTKIFSRQPNLNWTDEEDGVVICSSMKMAYKKQK
jgi:hypothetical protein